MDPQTPPDGRFELSNPELAGTFDEDLEGAALPTKWPTVVGTISIVYAAAGILLQTCFGAMIVFSEWAMKLGGIEVDMPPLFKIIGAASAVVLLAIGVLLLVAGIGLVRRRRASVGRHKLWAILRVIFVVISTGLGVFLMPASLELQENIQEATNDQMRANGRDDLVKEFDKDKAWTTSVIQTGAMAVGACLYPVFLVIFLSRGSVNDEVTRWD